MNAKKGSSQQPQLSKAKESNFSQLLLFLNETKHMYKNNYYWASNLVLDSFFNILNQVATITKKLSIPTLKSDLTDKQIGLSKASLQKEINLFLKSLQSSHLTLQTKNKDKRPSAFSHKSKPFEGLKTKREIANQNIIAKIKKKIKTQALNNSTIEPTSTNIEKHAPAGIRSISQTCQRDSWKMAGNITSRNTAHHSMNLSALGKERARSRDKVREMDNYRSEEEEHHWETSRGQSGKWREDSRGKKKSKGESLENGSSSDIKLSFYANRLVNQYHNVIHKYYTIKTEEEMKKIRALPECQKN